MRFLFIIFLFPIFLSANNPDTIINGKKYYLYSDRAMDDTLSCHAWAEKISKNGNACGQYFEFFASGKIKTSGRIRRGMKKGEWIYYFENGKKSDEGKFRGGKKNGIWLGFYQNGNKAYYEKYKHGLRIGKWMAWHEDGSFKGFAHYKISRRWGKTRIGVGSTRYWTPKWYLPWMVRTTSFSLRDSFVEYYPDGKLKSKILFDRRGKRNDTCLFYYPNGMVNHFEYWNHDNAYGCWKYFCPDGKLSFQNNMNSNICSCDPEIEIDGNCDYADISTDELFPFTQYDCYSKIRSKF